MLGTIYVTDDNKVPVREISRLLNCPIDEVRGAMMLANIDVMSTETLTFEQVCIVLLIMASPVGNPKSVSVLGNLAVKGLIANAKDNRR